MTGWHLAHFFAVALWGGLVLAEIVVEIAGRSERLRYATARFHYVIDMFVELPVLAAVVTTGVLLLFRVAVDRSLVVKIAFGIGGILANLGCVAVVVRRGRHAERDASEAALAPFTRWVFRSVFVGVPLALVALFMGGQRVGWW